LQILSTEHLSAELPPSTTKNLPLKPQRRYPNHPKDITRNRNIGLHQIAQRTRYRITGGGPGHGKCSAKGEDGNSQTTALMYTLLFIFLQLRANIFQLWSNIA